MTASKPRRRLDPGKRRENLLEHARRLIVERGLSACSLEEVAREAGVSKALVYKYFPDRDAVLKALVAHEYEVMPRLGGAAQPDIPFAEAIARVNRDSFRYLHERGPILRARSSATGRPGAHLAARIAPSGCAGPGTSPTRWSAPTASPPAWR